MDDYNPHILAHRDHVMSGCYRVKENSDREGLVGFHSNSKAMRYPWIMFHNMDDDIYPYSTMWCDDDMCPGLLLTRMLFRYFIGTSVDVVGAVVQAGGRLTISQEFDSFYSFIIQSSLHLMFLNFLIQCGICTKQEMELLSCDPTPYHLCQLFTDLCWGRMYGYFLDKSKIKTIKDFDSFDSFDSFD